MMLKQPFVLCLLGALLPSVAGYTMEIHSDGDAEKGSQIVRKESDASLAEYNAFLADPKKEYVQKMRSYDGGSLYLSTICVGGENMDGIMDTGSFNVMCVSTDCKDCGSPGYDPQLSSNFKPPVNASTKEVTFGSGPVVAESGKDVVKVGPDFHGEMEIDMILKHNIPELKEDMLECIIGIGPGEAKDIEERMPTKLQVEQFSFCLPIDGRADGKLHWNDPKQKSNNYLFNQVNVVGNIHWGVQMTNFTMKVGGDAKKESGKEIAVGCNPSCAAIIDTGTSLISAPKKVLNQLQSHLQKEGLDCTNITKLPHLHFKLGGHDFVLPPEAYVADAGEDDGGALPNIINVLYFKPQKFHRCVLLFTKPVPGNTKFGPVLILGMPFFRYYYTTFDWTHTGEGQQRRMYTSPVDRKDGLDPEVCEPTKLEDASRIEEVSLMEKSVTDRAPKKPRLNMNLRSLRVKSQWFDMKPGEMIDL